MSGDITDKVDMLENMNRAWADIYNGELQNELGKPFGVFGLTKYDLYNSNQDHFFPVRYKDNSFGIILPFRKKAFGGCVDILGPVDDVFVKFKRVLENKGYKVEYFLADTMKLVEKARKD